MPNAAIVTPMAMDVSGGARFKRVVIDGEQSTELHRASYILSARRVGTAGAEIAGIMLHRFLACVLLVVASAVAVPQHTAAVSHASERDRRAAIRSGSAGILLGAAIIVADFDADGAPDVAVADRVNRGSAYSIQLHLSVGHSQTLAFFSTKGALEFHAFDVDNDHDTDLIATPLLSRQVVGIWVNDGVGNFHRAHLDTFRSVVPMAMSSSTLSGLPFGRLLAISSRRLHSAVLRTRAFAFRPGPTTTLVAAGLRSAVADALDAGIGPRAPPSLHG